MEGDRRELATVSHRTDDTPARSRGGGSGNSPSPQHNRFRHRVEEVEGTLGSGGRGLGDGGETVSSREHGEGCDGNGASVFHLGEHGQSESERGKGERECGG
jgi:hypothetical protein